MCGVTLTISPASADSDLALARSLRVANESRGPNAHGIYARRITTAAADGRDLLITLASSVLGLRGRGGVTVQPLVGKDARGQPRALAWNGQVFSGMPVGIDENDTAKLFERLQDGGSPLEVLAAIEGPWAFVYISDRTITFGVDPLSRRSMLIHFPSSQGGCQSLVLSSTRSPLARELGVEMRALDGGQVGVIDLNALTVSPGGEVDWTGALTLSSLPPKVAPVNRALPTPSPSGLEAVQAEVDTFITQLTASVRRRVENIPPPLSPGASRICILFSGGVDCSLLVCLVHRVLPPNEPIELVNVAFAQPPKPQPKGKGKADAGTGAESYNVPDRISGREALAELRAAYPSREFRLVEVDVPVSEAREARQAVVDAMYPSATEMDLSLAYPLFFASRGRGHLSSSSSQGQVPVRQRECERGEDAARPEYTVMAKVYLSGLGADEQLAGYTRHRKAYERSSWPGLIDEIQLDLDRLPQRNLSRDDRVLSAHARDARYPYLDLEFVKYVSGLPSWAKCNLALPPGEGDKSLIRLAASQCGIPVTGRRVKRAMQFGTKSAKLYDGAPRGYKAGEQLIA